MIEIICLNIYIVSLKNYNFEKCEFYRKTCSTRFDLEFDLAFSVVIERSTAKRLKKLIHAKTLQARRYAQFEAMFRQTFQNHTLLLRFYAYGCYCLNLGDRPMAGIMTGMEPADLLDE